MTKKEYVIKALYALQEYWSYAPGLIKMMENNEISDEGILGLYDMISQAIKDATDETLRDKLTASMKYMDKLREMEQSDAEKMSDQDLEAMLTNA